MPAHDFADMAVAVVDDNRNFLRIMRSILRSFNVGTVFESEHPRQLLEHLRDHPVDVLMADNLMPGLDGLELIRRIRSDHGLPYRSLPIICISAYADRQSVENAVRVGADDFLVKPVRPIDVYRRLVKQICDPLPRIIAPQYYGPDRRRGLAPTYCGPNRRNVILI